MDSLIRAAAEALARGDVLGALKRVALREDAPALALRGIAMAQLGDLPRARALLRRAGRAFGPREAVARARCVVAEAEIALVSRELSWPTRTLEAARTTLQAHGDYANAAHARNLEARRLLLVGRLEEAERTIAAPDHARVPDAVVAASQLVRAGIAIRRLQIGRAEAALEQAERSARASRIPALIAEVEGSRQALDTVAARLVTRGIERPLFLAEVETLLATDTLIVDACRNLVRHRGVVISLATRPVLFALLRTLAEAWPHDVSRGALLAGAFGARHADESHRARLRVEIGRLRRELAALVAIGATTHGFVLSPRVGAEVAVLAPPVEGPQGTLLALLADGEAWSSSALAIALGASARTVQRALDQLAAAGKVRSFGRGPARRWVIPAVPGFPTSLLLPGPIPGS